MSTNRTPKPAKKPRSLPRALVKHANELAAQKRARLRAEAEQLVALVRQKRSEIADAFYDIGIALKRLRAPELVEALGHRSFDELCKTRLDLSASAGERLVHIVDAVPRQAAIELGQSKAAALVTLAEAAPGMVSPTDLLKKRVLRLPGGGTIDPHKATSRDLERAAKVIRQAARAGLPRRGRTTTEEERALAARIEASLHRTGAPNAKVSAVATRPGQPSVLRIEGVPVTALGALRKALPATARR